MTVASRSPRRFRTRSRRALAGGVAVVGGVAGLGLGISPADAFVGRPSVPTNTHCAGGNAYSNTPSHAVNLTGCPQFVSQGGPFRFTTDSFIIIAPYAPNPVQIDLNGNVAGGGAPYQPWTAYPGATVTCGQVVVYRNAGVDTGRIEGHGCRLNELASAPH